MILDCLACFSVFSDVSFVILFSKENIINESLLERPILIVYKQAKNPQPVTQLPSCGGQSHDLVVKKEAMVLVQVIVPIAPIVKHAGLTKDRCYS